MFEPDLNAPQRISGLERNAYLVALSRTIGDLLFGVLYLVYAFQTGGWQLQQAAFFTLALVVVDLIGVWYIRRGRPLLGVSLVLLGLQPVILITVGLISGLGVVLGLTVIILTTMSAIQVFQARRAALVIIVSVMVGIASPILDAFISTGSRLPVPMAIQTFLPLIVVLLVVAYAIMMLRQLSGFALRTKLVITFLIVSLLPLGILAYLDNRASRLALADAANQALFAGASKTASNIDSFIQTNLDAIASEAQIPLLRDYLEMSSEDRQTSGLHDEVVTILRAFQSKDPQYIISYSLLDPVGQVVADSTNLLVGELPFYLAEDESARKNYLLVLLTDSPSVSPMKFLNDSVPASLFFAARVSDSSGNPLGGVVAHYNAFILQELVAQNNGLVGPDSFGVLFDEFHIHLAHGIAPETIFKSTTMLPPQQLRDLQLMKRMPDIPAESLTTNLPELEVHLENAEQEPFFAAEESAMGRRRDQGAVAYVSTQPWVVAFFQPQDVFLAPVEAQTRLTLLLAVVIASLMVLAAVGAAQVVANPITRLTEVSMRISQGEISAPVPVETGDEIGVLASTFNSMTTRLRETLESLEDQVVDRTKDLERRAFQLQIAAQVTREAASIRDINQLLNQTVQRISQSFGFYHSGIFLIDDRGEYAVLQAASSEGGQRMLARGHRLKVGKVGIVGHVASSGEPRIALDVGTDAVYFDNPDLPLTRSEMSLPLKIRDHVIGILDVQSTEANAFTQEDVEILEIVADQLSLAIENARLLEESQSSLLELENLYKQQVQQAWQKRLRGKPLTYRYDRVGVERAEAQSLEGESTSETENLIPASRMDERHLFTPITLRGKTIGSVKLIRNLDQKPWSPEEMNLIEEVVSQVGLAFDNIRLVQETQLQAKREQTLNQLATRFTQSLDVDTLLRTAVTELGNLPEIEEVSISISPDSVSQVGAGDQENGTGEVMRG